MANTAQYYQVLVASPSDVPKERKLVEDVINTWTKHHGVAEGIVLIARGWESDVAPSLVAPAQDVINVKLVDNCDMVVAIFNAKVGTKTSKAESGTAEEIQRMVDKGAIAMVYFSDRPLNRNQIDLEELARLEKFKANMRAKGYLGSYKSLPDLRTKLTTALYQHVRDLKAKPVVAEVAASSTPRLSPISEAIQAATQAASLARLSNRSAGSHIDKSRFTLEERDAQRRDFEEKIAGGQFHNLSDGPMMFLSILTEFRAKKPADLMVARQHELFRPIGDSRLHTELHGSFVVATNGRDKPMTAVELTDVGNIFAAVRIEVVAKNSMSIFLMQQEERHLFAAVAGYLSLLNALEQRGPYEVRVGFKGTAGRRIGFEHLRLFDWDRGRAFKDDFKLLDVVYLDPHHDGSSVSDVAKRLRHSFTKFWRDGGFDHDPSFNVDGSYIADQ